MAAGCAGLPEGSGRRDARSSLSASRHDADGIGETVPAPLAVLDRRIGVGIGGVDRRREGIEHEPADRLGLGTLDEDLAVPGARTLEAAVQRLGSVVHVEPRRSDEHTSELQSLMICSYAVF